MKKLSPSALLLSALKEIILIKPTDRHVISNGVEVALASAKDWLALYRDSETIEQAAQRIIDGLCDGEFLGHFFPEATAEEAYDHGVGVGLVCDMIREAHHLSRARRQSAYARSLLGISAVMLFEMRKAIDALMEDEKAFSKIHIVEIALIELMKSCRRARKKKAETRLLLISGVELAQILINHYEGKEGAKAILGHTHQTHRGIRRLVKEAQALLDRRCPCQTFF